MERIEALEACMDQDIASFIRTTNRLTTRKNSDIPEMYSGIRAEFGK